MSAESGYLTVLEPDLHPDAHALKSTRGQYPLKRLVPGRFGVAVPTTRGQSRQQRGFCATPELR